MRSHGWNATVFVSGPKSTEPGIMHYSLLWAGRSTVAIAVL